MHNMRMQAHNAAFFDAIAARFMGDNPPVELTDRMLAAVARVLEPARAAGVLREGVEPGDISTVIKMLGAAIRPMPGDAARRGGLAALPRRRAAAACAPGRTRCRASRRTRARWCAKSPQSRAEPALLPPAPFDTFRA